MEVDISDRRVYLIRVILFQREALDNRYQFGGIVPRRHPLRKMVDVDIEQAVGFQRAIDLRYLRRCVLRRRIYRGCGQQYD
jgi:hypothetical protein